VTHRLSGLLLTQLTSRWAAVCQRSCGDRTRTRRTRAVPVVWALICAWSCGCGPARTPRPNILFLLVDSLRADHLGFAGYHRPTSPCLDSLAAHGAAFTSCTAQAPYTQASVPSLLTGRYPTSAFHLTEVAVPEASRRLSASLLGEEVLSIPALLRPLGYLSAMISASTLLKYRVLGLVEQFDYHDTNIECMRDDCAERINELVLRWLTRTKEEPWFCYVHYMDAHDPYSAPPEYSARFSASSGVLPDPEYPWMHRARDGPPDPEELAHIIGMYDAEIAYVDAQICRLLRVMRGLQLTNDLLVIVASDHGEEFYEHGSFTHGHSLYEEQTRCPLILAWPGHVPAGVRVECYVENVDIVPTLLDLLHVKAREELTGHSLVPYLEGRCSPRQAFSEKRGFSARRGRWKLWQDDSGTARLFDLVVDPLEQSNVAEAQPDTLKTLQSILDRWKSSLTPPRVRTDLPPSPMLDSAAVAKLRTLGYLQ
jgi:arylsulfatase